MKEMLKSKVMIMFVVLVIGISFIGGTNKLEQNNDLHEDYVAINIK